METLTENTALVSGGHPNGKGYILAGIAKRVYLIDDVGTCQYLPEKSSIIREAQSYDHNEELLKRDTDIYPIKLYTDIVIKGSIRFKQNEKQVVAEISIGNYSTSILAMGSRKAYKDNHNRIRFTEIEPVEFVPLRYDHAYGGVDMLAYEKYVVPWDKEFMKNNESTPLHCPYSYHRNPFGKGYMVEFDTDTFEEVELPNLEDPKDRLYEQNLFATNPGWWYKMPVPRATDWVNHDVFPRINYFGLRHHVEGNPMTAQEIERGWVLPEVFSKPSIEPNFELASRCTNGASLGLQLPYVSPRTTIRLKNIHPKFSEFKLKLPNDIPSIVVDGRNGKMLKTKPNIYTIEIDTENSLLSIVWGGYAKAIRPYHEYELTEMPIEVKW